MPLPRAVPRMLQHQRDIVLKGYKRADGMIDVEAHLTDTRAHDSIAAERGVLAAGELVHDMWLRVTVSPRMVVTECAAAMDAVPHTICPEVVPNYAGLVGLRIGQGFLREAAQRIGGADGCTHLRELLQQIATMAFQTMLSMNSSDLAAARGNGQAVLDTMLNTCHAFDETGPVIAEIRAAMRSG